MVKFFEKSIYLDPLTGLPNFFRLVESDARLLFDRCGAVIIFDVIKFTRINERYGTEAGDLCLTTLASIINEALSDYSDSYVFRTDGDEFTVILPLKTYKDTKDIIKAVKARFKDSIVEKGFGDINLRCLKLEYTGEIQSISKFYQLIFQQSMCEIKNDDEQDFEERWIEHIICSFTRRISETLSFFNDAYVLAMADDISGLPNHRAGKSYLKELFELCRKTEDEFSVLFIDGDNLKRYNEISYQSGNKMIKELSEIINSSLRKNDRIFRWFTGDEFLVVLPNVDSEAAFKLAERTRMAVEEQTKNWVFPVTISIGVAHFSKDCTDIDDIIYKAERANSFAKNLGKNRVIRWNMPSEVALSTITCV